MKYLIALSILIIFTSTAQSQNTGIGTPSPIMPLHVYNPTDTALLVIENGTPLTTGSNVGFYFRNGGNYTGAIKTTGTGSPFARLSFYTFANSAINALKERMTIADNGNVGIGTNDPQALLHLTGTLRYSAGTPGAGKVLTSNANGDASWTTPVIFSLPYSQSLNFAGDALSITNTNSTQPYYTAIEGTGPVGIVGRTNSVSGGTGVRGFGGNNSGVGVEGISTGPGSYSDIGGLVGVKGLTNTGIGVGGNAIGGTGVLGQASAAGGEGGMFEGTGGAKALQTSGPVQLTGISEGSGKVLTSDGSGNATWQNVVVPGVGANVTMSSNYNHPGGAQLLPFDFEQYDDGSNFNPAVGQRAFQAPTTGVYLVNVSVEITAPNAGEYNLSLRSDPSGVGIYGYDIRHLETAKAQMTLNYSRAIRLTAGQRVCAFLSMPSAETIVNTSATTFTITKLY